MRAAALIALILLSGCAGRDMDKICPIAEEVFSDPNISPEMKTVTFARRVDDEISSSAVRHIFSAIAMADPEVKYRLLQAGAAEVGRPDWSCPVLEEAMRPAPEPIPEPTPETPEPATSTGTLDKAAIQEIMRGAVVRARYCYEKQLMKDPKLAGKVVLTFTIGEDGGVASASAEGMENPALHTCLTEMARGLRFPKPSGGPVVVSYPFVFTAKD